MLSKKILILLLFLLIIGCGKLRERVNPYDPENKLYIRGYIEKDTVWTKENSPYILSGDIVVKTGVTLTIKPGTRIEFIPNIDTFGGGWYDGISASARCEIIIDGGFLIAEGTPTEPIIFTSYAENPKSYINQLPTPGDWGTIQISGKETGHKSIIKYCIIKYASIGIELWETNTQAKHPVIIDHNLISNCLIRGIGIRAGTPFKESEDSGAKIYYNEITNCGFGEKNREDGEERGGIVCFEGAQPLIAFNNIWQNIVNIKIVPPLYEVIKENYLISARNNYWGTNQEDGIKNSINDTFNIEEETNPFEIKKEDTLLTIYNVDVSSVYKINNLFCILQLKSNQGYIEFKTIEKIEYNQPHTFIHLTSKVQYPYKSNNNDKLLKFKGPKVDYTNWLDKKIEEAGIK